MLNVGGNNVAVNEPRAAPRSTPRNELTISAITV
jgi:hypothetical protein